MSDAKVSTGNFQDMLENVFGKKKDLPKQPPTRVETPKPKKPARSVITDVYSGASAQRFFDPAFTQPVQPPAKAPNEKQINRGTVESLDTQGPWGEPEAMAK